MANADAWAAGWDKGSKKKTKKDSSDAGKGDSAWTEGWNSKMAKPSSFKKGGKVRKTGMAKVHKGEKVLTATQAKMCAGKSKNAKKSSARKRAVSKG